MLQGLCVVVHSGDDAVPVEGKGMSKSGLEDGFRQVRELWWDWLWGIVSGRWLEAASEVSGGELIFVQFMEGGVVCVELCDVGADVVVDLTWKETTSAEIQKPSVKASFLITKNMYVLHHQAVH